MGVNKPPATHTSLMVCMLVRQREGQENSGVGFRLIIYVFIYSISILPVSGIPTGSREQNTFRSLSSCVTRPLPLDSRAIHSYESTVYTRV